MVTESNVSPMYGKRSRSINRYFTPLPPPDTPTVAIGAGAAGAIVIVLASLAGGTLAIVLGIVGVVSLVVSWYRYQEYVAERGPTDAKVDSLLESDLGRMAHAFWTELEPETDESDQREGPGDPVYAVDIADGNRTGDEGRLRVRIGEDGKLRAERYEVTIIFLAAEGVYTFECVLDFVTGTFACESRHADRFGNIGLDEAWQSLTRPVGEAVDVINGDIDPEISRRRVFVVRTLRSDTLVKLGEYSDDGQRRAIKVAWANDATRRTLWARYRKHGGF